MELKLRGFDQITAWIGGLIISGGVFAAVWYFGKYASSVEANRDLAKLEAAQKELELLNSKSTLKEDELLNSVKGANDQEKSTDNLRPGLSTVTSEKWGYSGRLAPWYWENLNSGWKACGSKSGQSPVDISGSKLDDALKKLKFLYGYGVTHFTFHHQTIQGDIDHGSYLEWDGERFDLSRVYFRTPSEHSVNSLPFEMEVQLEHISASGGMIMVSILVSMGRQSDLLHKLSVNLPRFNDDIKDIGQLNWTNILPDKRIYSTYIGSATTPPCAAGVRWIIFSDTIQSDRQTIDKFVLMQKNNVRPIAPLGQRSLTRSNR